MNLMALTKRFLQPILCIGIIILTIFVIFHRKSTKNNAVIPESYVLNAVDLAVAHSNKVPGDEAIRQVLRSRSVSTFVDLARLFDALKLGYKKVNLNSAYDVRNGIVYILEPESGEILTCMRGSGGQLLSSNNRHVFKVSDPSIIRMGRRALAVECSAIVVNRPKIAFDAIAKSAGQVRKKKIVEFSFKAYNEGNQPLLISRVLGSCSCIGNVEGTKEIPPGGEGTIVVRLNTAGKAGFERQFLAVESNDQECPVAKLDISAEILPIPELVPDSIDFGEVAVDEFEQRDLRLKIPKGGSINIKAMPIRGDRFVVSQGEKADEFAVAFRGTELGTFSEQLTLSNDLERDPITLQLVATVVPHHKITPSALFLRQTDLSSLPIAKAIVRRRDGGLINIKDVKIMATDTQYAVDVIALDDQRLQIVCRLTEPRNQPINSRILVLAGGESISVPIIYIPTTTHT